MSSPFFFANRKPVMLVLLAACAVLEGGTFFFFYYDGSALLQSVALGATCFCSSFLYGGIVSFTEGRTDT